LFTISNFIVKDNLTLQVILAKEEDPKLEINAIILPSFPLKITNNRNKLYIIPLSLSKNIFPDIYLFLNRAKSLQARMQIIWPT